MYGSIVIWQGQKKAIVYPKNNILVSPENRKRNKVLNNLNLAWTANSEDY